MPGGRAASGGDPSPAQICYSQPTDGTGNGVLSEDFGTGSFSGFTSLGADDFRLLNSCTITQLVIPGQVSGSTTAVGSFTVTFYNDSGATPAQPGTVAYPATSVVPVTGPPGTYTLTLPGAGFAAAANTIYWVSVQAANVTPYGDIWYWDTAFIQGYPADWENPTGGFGACATWAPLQPCVGVNSDFAFELDGTTAPPPCYSQLGTVAKPVNSQGPPGIPPARRTEAADDFVLAQPCIANSVDVLGTYVGSGTATSFRVRFYLDTGGGVPLPTPWRTRIVTAPTVTGQTFHLPWSGTGNGPVALVAGQVYWVSVEARGLTTANRWRWYSRAQIGNPAYWRNGGYWNFCTTWMNMQSCHIPSSVVAPDLEFTVNP